jgi:AcrR family transcriptional regulator
MEALTMRALADATGCPAATIQYQFGSKQNLLRATFEYLVESHLSRLDAVEDFVSPTDPDISILPRILTHVICHGGKDARREQLALVELLALALRNSELMPVVERWIRPLEQFWRSVAERGEQNGHMGIFLLELYLGLAFHMSGIEPAMEAELISQEIIDRALRPAEQRTPPLWFNAILREVLRTGSLALGTYPIPATPTARTILQAAMTIAVDEGPGQLSFRSVATRAATSVSAIAHYFPTRQALLFATYRTIHEEIIAFTRRLVTDRPSRYDSGLAEEIVTYRGDGPLALLIAYSELELVAARTDDFRYLARYLRMTRGLYHVHRHDPGFDPCSSDAFDGFALSFWMVGHTLRTAMPFYRDTSLELLRSVEFGFRQFGMN